MGRQRLEHHLEGAVGDFGAPVNRMAAVHQHLRLNNGDQSGRLAQVCVTGQSICIIGDAATGGEALTDGNDRPPLGKREAHTGIFLQPWPQTVETCSHFFAGVALHILGPLVDFDARLDAEAFKERGERHVIIRALPDGFIKHDDATDVVFNARRCEQQVAVRLPRLFRVLNTDHVESLLDGAGAFIRGKNPFSRGHHGLGSGC